MYQSRQNPKSNSTLNVRLQGERLHQRENFSVAEDPIESDAGSEDDNGGIRYPPMGFGKHKPRLLLMGLKRYSVFSTLFTREPV